MTKLLRTRCDRFSLRGGLSLPTAVGDSPLIAKKTGSPTVLGANGGGIQISLTATNEVQVGTIYMGDILPYPINLLKKVHFLVSCSAALDASIKAAWGIASATNDDLDAIAAAALFKMDGSNAVVCESDDGTTDKNDIATGMTLDTEPRWCTIDLEVGVTRKGPPAISQGHSSNVRFYGEKSHVNLMQLAQTTHFDMSAYTGNLQPLIRLQKSAGTVTGSFTLHELEVEYVCG